MIVSKFPAMDDTKSGPQSDTAENQIALKLLVIGDDSDGVQSISEALNQRGLEILSSFDIHVGFELFRKHRPRMVLLELVKSGGMELLERILAVDPGVDVIVISGDCPTETAFEAIQKGASDYLTLPVDMQKLRSRVTRLIQEAARRHKILELDQELVDMYQFEAIVGRSPVMLDVFAKIDRISPHFRTVLVRGATGTGKELVARALHRRSPGASGQFGVCNCSALVDTLLESELFGHTRGAFTGAMQDKPGVFEYANGGTVFLDEVGELSPAGQAKLLRVLQNRQVQRVGSPVLRDVDVRVVAATHRDLRAMVKEGRFREDLYYRLAIVEITLPRLADRKEDLPLLQRFFVRKFAAEYKKEISGITRRAQTRMASYSWPGNIRELENVIGNACMMADGTTIDINDLPESVRAPVVEEDTGGADDLISLDEVERRHILRVLSRVDGNKARAAEILGIGRATVYQLLSKWKIENTETSLQ